MDVYGSGAFHLPTRFLVLLASGGLHEFAYGMRPVYGLLRFLHLLAMAGFVGTILLVQIKRLGFFPEAALHLARQAVLPMMNYSFSITLVSGLLLFLYDPIGAGLHTMFLPKLILITFGLFQAYWLERQSFTKKLAAFKRISAGIALTIWILVIGCSTYNHMERPLNPADVHRLEKSTYND
jgi:hypothetical protein